MTKTHEGSHSHWPFTCLTLICMVSTFALGWYLLKEFVSELIQSRSEDELYSDIMHTGLIVCIFNISKFYLLLCFRKKLEIVDLVDSETDGNSTDENYDIDDAYENDRDGHRVEGQHTQSQGLQKEQSAGGNGADLNMDENQEEQIVPDIQDGPNLDGNEQVQGQISQDYEGREERVLAPDDIQVHMHDSGNKNIQLRRSTRDRKMSGRFRSQSMSEGQNYKISKRQEGQNNDPRKLLQSNIRRKDPRPSKPSQKTQSTSNSEKTQSLYDLRHRSCFSERESLGLQSRYINKNPRNFGK